MRCKECQTRLSRDWVSFLPGQRRACITCPKCGTERDVDYDNQQGEPHQPNDDGCLCELCRDARADAESILKDMTCCIDECPAEGDCPVILGGTDMPRDSLCRKTLKDFFFQEASKANGAIQTHCSPNTGVQPV